MHFSSPSVKLFINCWNASSEVTSAMKQRGLGVEIPDFLQLWSEFHNAQLQILDEESGDKTANAIIWSSMLSSPTFIEKFLNKTKFVVQTWVESRSDLNAQLLDLGYRLIVSTKDAWYLDHGFWGNTKYHTWRVAYNNRIPRKVGLVFYSEQIHTFKTYKF